MYAFQVKQMLGRPSGPKKEMKLQLREATEKDISLIHQMQKSAFYDLLEKYQDYKTNPGSETEEVVRDKFYQENTKYFLIILNMKDVCGAIRIVTEEKYYRISPIFIIPQYQNKGIAQKVFRIIEDEYTQKDTWSLSTIKEEGRNCHIYEKNGYKRTGKEEKIKEGMTLIYYEKKCPTKRST